jgi:hypothetical protein
VKILREHFLPKENEFSPTGQYSQKQYDLAKAFVLLVHAEVESFLEDISRDRAKKLENVWAKKQRRSKGIRRLIHSHNLHSRQPWQPVDWSPDRINSAINFYNGLINSNNGIKEKDICQLFFPLGIRYEEFNVTWLADMSSFGAARGGFAHGSVKTHQPVDPQSELDKVKRLVKGLARLDRRIGALG